VGALAQLKAAPNDLVFYPAAVCAQATELRGPALLTGFMDACLAYNVTKLVCLSTPSTPIKTDQGNLYFQKQTLFGHSIFVASHRQRALSRPPDAGQFYGLHCPITGSPALQGGRFERRSSRCQSKTSRHHR